MREFPYQKWQTPMHAKLYSDEWEFGIAAAPPPIGGGLLKEDGDFILQENSFFILLET